MFTGIIESLGEVKALNAEGTNLHLSIESSISSELKIDQSVSHNGVCLTVVEVDGNLHTVTAIDETLQRTNLSKLMIGDKVNIERAMITGSRFDGHFVQGHVDTTGLCNKVEEKNGSYIFTFSFSPSPLHLVVEKGSVCIDGTSLTVVDAGEDFFSVAIIPYTFDNTLFRSYRSGSIVNLEFDVIGKYLQTIFDRYKGKLS